MIFLLKILNIENIFEVEDFDILVDSFFEIGNY